MYNLTNCETLAMHWNPLETGHRCPDINRRLHQQQQH